MTITASAALHRTPHRGHHVRMTVFLLSGQSATEVPKGTGLRQRLQENFLLDVRSLRSACFLTHNARDGQHIRSVRVCTRTHHTLRAILGHAVQMPFLV